MIYIGKNNGTVDGHEYFQCRDKYGLFVKPDRISSLPPGTTKSATGSSRLAVGKISARKPSPSPTRATKGGTTRQGRHPVTSASRTSRVASAAVSKTSKERGSHAVGPATGSRTISQSSVRVDMASKKRAASSRGRTRTSQTLSQGTYA